MKGSFAIAVTLVAVALAGCNEGSSPSSNASSQTSPAAAETSSTNLPVSSDNNTAPGTLPPQTRAAQSVSPDTAPPRTVVSTRLPPRAASRTVGAGIRAQIDVFYDDLGRYGSWVRHPDFSYVWLPGRRGHGWRPYQEGRWIWTDDYGWYWESSEPFAWAVYHYGRWGYDPDYGWFWVPGDTWAPAWVTWRHSRDRIGWAPIAPDRKGYARGAPRRFEPPVLESWVFVEDRNFTDPDLGQYVVPIPQIGAMLDAASDLESPIYENGVVINRGIRREEIERAGGRRIETREIVYVGDEGDSFEDVRGVRIGIYRPVIENAEIRRPPRVVVTDVTRVDRVVIREYTEARVRGVPSIALLTVLDNRERQSLQEDRLTQQEVAVDRQIERLREERAALLEERRRQAEGLQTQIAQERQEGIRQRMQEHQRLLEQRRQRAEAITTIDTPPASTTPPNQHLPPPAEATAPAAPPAQHAPPPAAATAPAALPAQHAPPPAAATAPAALPAQHAPPPAAATAPAAPPAQQAPPPAAATAPAAPPAQLVPPASASAPAAPPAQHAAPPAAATAPAAAPSAQRASQPADSKVYAPTAQDAQPHAARDEAAEPMKPGEAPRH